MKRGVFMLALNQLLLVTFSVSAQSACHIHTEAYLVHVFNIHPAIDTARAATTTSASPENEEAWKQWQTVENYFYGKNRGSIPMIADLRALHPYFRDKVIELISRCRKEGIELAVVESYRTAAKQSQYFAMGREYTGSPAGKSRHQYGLAVDVVPMVNGHAVWNNRRLWRKIGITGERLGLRWGGRWHITYDPGHFEWSGGLSKEELSEGYWPEIPPEDAARYPNIREQLAALAKDWEAWATEQSAIVNNQTHAAKEEVTGVGN